MPTPPWTSPPPGIEPRILPGAGTTRGAVSERRIGKHEGAPAAYQPYDRRAPEVARTVKAMIWRRLPGVAVEHVGSTAVPGCAGKGVIDLLLPYGEGELEPIKDTLEDLGFQRQSTRNPFPDRPTDARWLFRARRRYVQAPRTRSAGGLRRDGRPSRLPRQAAPTMRCAKLTSGGRETS